MFINANSIGQLASDLRCSVGTLHTAIQRANCQPAMILDGMEYYHKVDVESIARAVRDLEDRSASKK